MKAEVLTGLSMGFETIKDEWDRDENVRFVKEVKLWEGSLVTFPANDLARIDEVKSAQQFDRIMGLILSLKDRDLSVHEQELIYKAAHGLSALIGGQDPLPIGWIGGTPPNGDSQDKDNDPEILHSLSGVITELKALNSIFGG